MLHIMMMVWLLIIRIVNKDVEKNNDDDYNCYNQDDHDEQNHAYIDLDQCQHSGSQCFLRLPPGKVLFIYSSTFIFFVIFDDGIFVMTGTMIVVMISMVVFYLR